MRVYLDDDGKYKNWWSRRVLIPTAEQLRMFAILDVAQDVHGFARIGDCARNIAGAGLVYYDYPGEGNYEPGTTQKK